MIWFRDHDHDISDYRWHIDSLSIQYIHGYWIYDTHIIIVAIFCDDHDNNIYVYEVIHECKGTFNHIRRVFKYNSTGERVMSIIVFHSIYTVPNLCKYH